MKLNEPLVDNGIENGGGLLVEKALLIVGDIPFKKGETLAFRPVAQKRMEKWLCINPEYSQNNISHNKKQRQAQRLLTHHQD